MPHLAGGASGRVAGIGLGLILAGCGGGGGGGDDGRSATVLQPHALPDLSLSRARTAEVTEEFLLNADLALYFALFGVDLSGIPLGLSDGMPVVPWTPLSLPCAQGGTVAFERIGPGSGPLVAGDSIRAVFSACRDSAVTLNGEVRLDISTLAANADSVELAGQVRVASLSATGGGFTISMSAVLPVTYDGEAMADRYRVSGGWLQVNEPSGRETVTGLILDYRQDYSTYRYWMDLSATLTSDWLNGTVHGTTVQPFEGQINQWPFAGRLELFGAGNRSVALQANSSPSGSQAINASLIDEPTGDVLDTWTALWPGGFAEMFIPLRADVPPPKQPDTAPQPAPPLPEPEPDIEPGVAAARHIQLGAPPTDLVVDEKRRQFYVAVADRNEIVAIDLDTLLIDRRISVAGRPQRLGMSLDGDTLFITAGAAGSVVALNLEDDSAERIDLVVQLNHSMAWDVVEYQPGKLLVTANPGGGFGYVVNVDLATGQAERVADNWIVRNAPYVLHKPGDRFAYVGASDRTVRRLDLDSPGIPIVAQTPHTGINGTNHMALNADGTRIVLETGQVLRTGSLAVELNLPRGGRPQFSRDFEELMVWAPQAWSSQLPAMIDVYDAASLELVDQWDTACGPPPGASMFPLWSLRHLEQGRWAFLRDNMVCVADRRNPGERPGLGGSPLPPAPPNQAVAGARLEFAGIVNDAVVDAPAGLAYVSIPVTGEVHQISASTLSIQRTLQFPAEARGLDLSADGSVLYVVVTPGAGLAGSVVRIDTATGATLSETAVHHPQTAFGGVAHSVLSVAPGRMLVDAGNGIVEIQGYHEPLLLSVPGTNLSSTGKMLLAPDGGSAYLGNRGVSPPSVRRINLGTEWSSVDGQNVHGGISSPGTMAISPDGSRLYLESGQVLATSTVMPAGIIGAGVPQPLRDGSAILVAAAPTLLERYDAQHEILTARYTTNCANPTVSHLLSALDDSVWLVIGGDILCAVVLPED